MKKLIVLSIFSFLFSMQIKAQAPSYVDFEWDILRLGYASPLGDNANTGGISFGGELRYNLKDNFSIGLGGEAVLFSTDFEGDVDVSTSSNLLLSGDYYLNTTSGNRGFVGLGVGNFKSGSIEFSDGEPDSFIEGQSSFGLSPRVGFELGHIRFMANYNHTFKSEVPNYFNATVALTLWGGYKG